MTAPSHKKTPVVLGHAGANNSFAFDREIASSPVARRAGKVLLIVYSGKQLI
ncbi:MAG TPA: hypothetical protein VIS99_07575 [Terrimicrobiaceae bacterium]